MLVRIVSLLIGYAFGLFQTSYIYGRKNGIDIREHGSGNAGTTNALRTLGKKAGAVTLLGDCLKCALAILAVYLLFGRSHPQLVRLLAAFDWRLFLICAVVFFTAFFLSHYVSLGSLLGYFFFAVGVIVSGQIGRYDVDPGVLHEMYILALLLMALAFWRHRQNIVRLIRGNENKIYLGKH